MSAGRALLLIVIHHGSLGLVGATGGLNRVVAVFHDKLDKGLERSVTVVIDEVSASGRLELEGRETCRGSMRISYKPCDTLIDQIVRSVDLPATSKGALGGTSFSVASILAL
jgi:hypothetical protein